MFRLAWVRLGVPQGKLESVVDEKETWNTRAAKPAATRMDERMDGWTKFVLLCRCDNLGRTRNIAAFSICI